MRGSDVTEAKWFIFSILNESWIGGLFGLDKLIQARGGFWLDKRIIEALELARNETLTDDGVGTSVRI